MPAAWLQVFAHPANGRHHLPGTGLNTAYGRTRLGNEIHRIGRFLAAALDLADRLVGQQMIVRDHRIDLGRGGAGAPRQFAHFIGHHGEAPPLVAGARSFDRGIQGQQVGLLRNGPNGLHDRTDDRGLLAQGSNGIASAV